MFEQIKIKSNLLSSAIQDLLVVFAGADANFAVTCLEDSWTASAKYGKVMYTEPEALAEYHNLIGSGIRDNYICRHYVCGDTWLFFGRPKNCKVMIKE